MLDNIKYLMCLKTIDKNILEGNFELALEKLNFLIREEYKPSTTYLKRGKLCKKLLMYEDAYSDFTYVIGHCAQKKEAFFERLFLNYEINNYYEAIYYVKEALKITNKKLTYITETFSWNETIYDSNEKLDYIKTVVCDGKTSTAISNIYYINISSQVQDKNVSVMDREYSLNNYENKYKKTDNTSVEYYFENQAILNELKKAGYRYLITTDGNLSPISNIEDVNRLHIIAIKREQ